MINRILIYLLICLPVLTLSNSGSFTSWVVIAGGKHSQFGWYGLQPRDYPAAFTHEGQMHQIVDATLAALASLMK
jgi:hypothetical protein